MRNETSRLGNIILNHQTELLEGWVSTLVARTGRREANAETELRQQASRFLSLVGQAVTTAGTDNIDSNAWQEARQLLSDISATRVRQGHSSIETANFMFSLKEPLFGYLQAELGDDPAALVEEITATNALFDTPGPVHHRGVPEGARAGHPAPAAGTAGAVDPGRAALGGHPGAAADRHARQRPHPGRDGKPAAEDRRHRRARSPSSTSPACPPSTRWSPSTC